MHGWLRNPPVEPDELRLVLVDQLRTPRQPVFEERAVGRRLLVFRRFTTHCGTVEFHVPRVAHIGVERLALVEEPPVLDTVRREAEHEALCPNRLGELANDVASGAHLGCSPRREAAVVHREAIMVFSHRHDVACAGCLEQGGPSRRVEVLRREARDEILVAEPRLRAVGRNVVRELLLVALVHVPRVPLVAKRRHRVDTPMDEDAELRVLVPVGHLVAREGVPAGRERPLSRHGPYLAHLRGDVRWALGDDRGTADECHPGTEENTNKSGCHAGDSTEVRLPAPGSRLPAWSRLPSETGSRTPSRCRAHC